MSLASELSARRRAIHARIAEAARRVPQSTELDITAKPLKRAPEALALESPAPEAMEPALQPDAPGHARGSRPPEDREIDHLTGLLELRASLSGTAFPEPPERPSVLDIITATSEVTGVPVDVMTSAARERAVVRPRQIAMYAVRVLLDKPLPAIGRKLGGKDHTTVLHSVRKIQELLDDDDPQVADWYAAILKRLDEIMEVRRAAIEAAAARELDVDEFSDQAA